MSTTENLEKPERPLTPEELRARAEAPDFAETHKRAVERARGVPRRAERTRGGTPAVTSEKDFKACLSRILDAAGVTQESYTREPKLPRTAKSAPQNRIELYVPERHRLASLHQCPRPVEPTQALPKGQCRCADVRHYVPQNESQQAAHQAARVWVDAAEAGDGPALLLIGPTGVGKSHLLYASVRELNLRGVNSGAAHWGKFSDVLRDAKSLGDAEARSEAVFKRDRLLACAAISLDEVRPTAQTDFDPMELAKLLTWAHDNLQAVFLTSQLRGDSLDATTSLAATGRLMEVEMEGNNYRKPEGSRHLRAV